MLEELLVDVDTSSVVLEVSASIHQHCWKIQHAR
jgi:hypothetical protein